MVGWVGFTAFVLFMLAVDLGLFHRKHHEVSAKEALIWSIVWIVLSLAFAGGIFFHSGPKPALEYLTGYVIEKALSVDNLFVFLVVFEFFRVPRMLQHTVLFWGVLGALVLRAIFVLAGTALLAKFHWLIYVFGAFLIFTGGKLLIAGDDDDKFEDSRAVRFFRRVIPTTEEYVGGKFVIRRDGRFLATPLLLVLLVLEATDLVFALDSVPAVLAISKNPFIVWTSNVFAILGLRSLFFLLAGALAKFEDLKVGLALVLVFVGSKMAASDLYEIPVGVSLLVVATLIGGAMLVSSLRTHPKDEEPAVPSADALAATPGAGAAPARTADEVTKDSAPSA